MLKNNENRYLIEIKLFKTDKYTLKIQDKYVGKTGQLQNSIEYLDIVDDFELAGKPFFEEAQIDYSKLNDDPLFEISAVEEEGSDINYQ